MTPSPDLSPCRVHILPCPVLPQEVVKFTLLATNVPMGARFGAVDPQQPRMVLIERDRRVPAPGEGPKALHSHNCKQATCLACSRADNRTCWRLLAAVCIGPTPTAPAIISHAHHRATSHRPTPRQLPAPPAAAPSRAPHPRAACWPLSCRCRRRCSPPPCARAGRASWRTARATSGPWTAPRRATSSCRARGACRWRRWSSRRSPRVRRAVLARE
jgi:hypothetical protein